MKTFFPSFWFVPAYLKLGIETAASLPAVFIVTVVLAFSLLATAARWSPLTAQQFALMRQSSSLSAFEPFLHFLQAAGDHRLAEEVFSTLSPALSAQKRSDFDAVIHPEKRAEALRKFWEEAFNQQPNAREVRVALTVLQYQLYNDSRAQEHLVALKKIEPNDTRIKQIEILLDALFNEYEQ